MWVAFLSALPQVLTLFVTIAAPLAHGVDGVLSAPVPRVPHCGPALPLRAVFHVARAIKHQPSNGRQHRRLGGRRCYCNALFPGAATTQVMQTGGGVGAETTPRSS